MPVSTAIPARRETLVAPAAMRVGTKVSRLAAIVAWGPIGG